MRSASALHPVVAQFFGFAVVGLVGTAAHYAVLWFLVEFGSVSVVAATTAGFAVGAIVNYFLNRRFTFTSDATHAAALPKFLVIAALCAVVNALVVAWLLEHTNVHYLLIQLFATGTVFVWNFIANSLWTFRT